MFWEHLLENVAGHILQDTKVLVTVGIRLYTALVV
jgi:hypothetical protein